MAGPWFMVQTTEDGWQTMDKIWVSDGKTSITGRVQLRIRYEEARQ